PAAVPYQPFLPRGKDGSERQRIPLPGGTHMSQGLSHALEPLSAEEVRQAVQRLKEHGKGTPTTRFVSGSLKEPPRDPFHGFPAAKGIAPPREAFAVLFDNGTNSCYEATLSLTHRQLLGYKHVAGAQPTMTIDEQVECEQAVLASPAFKAAL